MKKNKTVEDYLDGQGHWQEILVKLRELLQSTELKETIKWGAPVYTLNGKHVVGMGAFKSYAGLWFFQGTFLSDPHNLLINAQEGRTKALRQMRFSSLEEMNEEVIRTYILEAIQNQKEGKEIKPDLNKPLVVPDELTLAITENPELEKAFGSLTLGRQREFSEYISEAKRADTRQKRLEKITPMILEGVGLNDKYRGS